MTSNESCSSRRRRRSLQNSAHLPSMPEILKEQAEDIDREVHEENRKTDSHSVEIKEPLDREDKEKECA